MLYYIDISIGYYVETVLIQGLDVFRYIFNGCSETSQASFGVTPSVQVQPQPCPPLPCLLSLFLSLPVFARIFLFPTHLLRGHIIYVNLQPPSHIVLLLYQTPGSIYGGTPVPGRREAKYISENPPPHTVPPFFLLPPRPTLSRVLQLSRHDPLG